MPGVQTISLPGGSSRSWSVYNPLRCCGEDARTALRSCGEGGSGSEKEERLEKFGFSEMMFKKRSFLNIYCVLNENEGNFGRMYTENVY